MPYSGLWWSGDFWWLGLLNQDISQTRGYFVIILSCASSILVKTAIDPVDRIVRTGHHQHILTNSKSNTWEKFVSVWLAQGHHPVFAFEDKQSLSILENCCYQGFRRENFRSKFPCLRSCRRPNNFHQYLLFSNLQANAYSSTNRSQIVCNPPLALRLYLQGSRIHGVVWTLFAKRYLF